MPGTTVACLPLYCKEHSRRQNRWTLLHTSNNHVLYKNAHKMRNEQKGSTDSPGPPYILRRALSCSLPHTINGARGSVTVPEAARTRLEPCQVVPSTASVVIVIVSRGTSVSRTWRSVRSLLSRFPPVPKPWEKVVLIFPVSQPLP